ncbi:hypothetical protein [Methylosinus sp. PW1]|uniref:hypothetical protein n=1 Tax=Methylosinus sp. PW1 TaxID=107636 RepID=UPI000564FF0F|nr:hypothetical protein [Methylosinus sp. PW1]
MPNTTIANADRLHWPGRAHFLQSVEQHACQAAGLARALWNAIEGLDGDIDERDKMALYELAGAVSDHASATLYALYREDDLRRAARPVPTEEEARS